MAVLKSDPKDTIPSPAGDETGAPTTVDSTLVSSERPSTKSHDALASTLNWYLFIQLLDGIPRATLLCSVASKTPRYSFTVDR